jgi:hypothetical protein
MDHKDSIYIPNKKTEYMRALHAHVFGYKYVHADEESDIGADQVVKILRSVVHADLLSDTVASATVELVSSNAPATHGRRRKVPPAVETATVAEPIKEEEDPVSVSEETIHKRAERQAELVRLYDPAGLPHVCPKCKTKRATSVDQLVALFGLRQGPPPKAGGVGRVLPQPWCKECKRSVRSTGARPAQP